MINDNQPIPGDQARVSVVVGVPPDVAFRIFTEEIDLWWRRGLKYRVAGTSPGSIHMEPRQGGLVFESFESGSEMKIVETGKITLWEPPSRVTVTHRGWSRIRADHPVRHNLDMPSFIGMIGLWWGDLMTSLRDYSAASHHMD